MKENPNLDLTRTLLQSEDEDPRVAEAMEVYLAELEAGTVPSRGEFLARFPEIADKLAGHLEGLDFLHGIAPQAADGQAESMRAGGDTLLARASLGDFRLIRQIGRGGMGVVYEAEQLSLRRKVAVKVLPFAAMLDDQHRKRFYNEARAAATLDHPHIVPVHFVGQERGVHFFAMHLIEGQSLAELIEGLRGTQQNKGVAGVWTRGSRAPSPQVRKEDVSQAGGSLTLDHQPPSGARAETAPNFHSQISTQRTGDRGKFFRTAARLGAEAAEALEHAHQVGILHRDIKPGNLLIDAAGKLWVADFGLATMEQEETLTRTGGVLGTAAYMSPEQAADSHRIDGRSDIYSLGATLYELLTLRRHRGDDLTREDANRNTNINLSTVRRFNSTIPPDLETIVIKALSDDPADRYQTALAMADDLRSFIDGREIKARRLTFLQRQARWLRHHRRLTTGTIAASFLLIAAFGTTMTLYSRQLADHGQQLQAALTDANQFRTQAEEQTLLAVNQLKRAEQSEQATRRSELFARRMSYRSDTQRAFEKFSQNNLADTVKLLTRQDGELDSEDLRGIEWRILKAESNAVRQLLGSHDGSATECVLYPDGNTVATSGEDGLVHVWDVAGRHKIKSLAPKIGPIHALAISPDGKTLAVGGSPSAGPFGFAAVQLLDAETGESKETIQLHKTTIESIRFSPDGNLVAAGSRYEDVKLSTIDGKAMVAFKTDTRNESIAFSPDSKSIATAWQKNRRVRIWDCETGDLIAESITAPNVIGSIVWGPSDFIIGTAKGSPWVAAIDVETGGRLSELLVSTPVPRDIAAVAISADGETVTAGDSEGKLHQWQVYEQNWREWFKSGGRHAIAKPIIDPLAVGSEAVMAMVVAADGSVVTAHRGGRIMLSNPRRSVARIHSLDFDVTAASLAADSSIYLGASDGSIHRFDDTSQETTLMVQAAEGAVTDLAVSGDSTRLAVAYESGKVELILLATCESIWSALRTIESEDPSDQIVVSHDARYLACASDDEQLTIWDIEQNRQILHRQTPAVGRSIALSPGGQWIAHGRDGASLIEFPSGNMIREFHQGEVAVVQFSPDGRYLVRGARDGIIRVYDFEAQSDLFLRGHARGVSSVAFSRNGRTFVTTDRDDLQRIRFWDTETGEPYGDIGNPLAMWHLVGRSKVKVFVTDHQLILCSIHMPHSKIAIWNLTP